MGQISLFDGNKEFRIDKPIRLIELNNLEIIVTSNGLIYTKDKLNIRSNGRINNRKGKMIKPTFDKDGYLKITLSYKKKRKTYFVHRLIARAFLSNYNESLQVNHKDGIKTNNNVVNLEMVTLQENIKHSIVNHLKPKMIRDKYGKFLRKGGDANEQSN